MNYLSFMKDLPRPLFFIIGFIITLVIICDFFLGKEVNSSLLYLIPIYYFARQKIKIPVYTVAIICFASWFINDITYHELPALSFPFIINTALTAGFFLLFSVLLLRLKTCRIHAKELERHDSLTGLANAKYIIESGLTEINRCNRLGHSFCLIYIDCDNFKQINDEFGHPHGDLLLKTIAALLRKKIRAIDIAARMGGDEFTILMPEVSYKEVLKIVPRIRILLLKKMKENSWKVTFSMGAAIFKNCPDSIDEVIKKADDLMYKAKRSGKDRIKYKIF